MMKFSRYALLVTGLCTPFMAGQAHAFDPTIPPKPGVEINFSVLDQISTPAAIQPAPTPAQNIQSAAIAAPPSAQIPPQPIPVREAMPELFAAPPAAVQPDKPISKKEALSMDVVPEVKVLHGTPPPFSLWAADWSGRVNVGAGLKKGNGENQNVNVDASTKAQWENKDRLGMAAYYNYEDDDDTKTVDEKGFSIYFDDFLTNSLFLDYNGRIESDEIAGVDMRSVFGISLGHQLFDTPSLKVSYALGPSYLIEEKAYISNDETIKEFSYNWKFDIEKHLKDDMAILYHEHTWLAPADDTGDYVFDSHTGVRVPLKEKLVATLDIEHDIDKTVDVGLSETDTKYSLKIGYEW